MARAKPDATAKALAAAKKQSDDALTLQPGDAHNLLVFLNRCPSTGVDEATLLALLAQKLKSIKGDYTGEQPSG